MKSSVVEEEHLYSCLSPRGSHFHSPQPDVLVASIDEGMDEILAPVLQITPELGELCGESSLIPSMVLPLELGSSEALAVATTPSPASVDNGVLTHNAETVFARELFGLLASLEAASPRYSKDINCILAGKASDDLIGKVEKFLRWVSLFGKRGKRGMTRKASTTA
jgi:hypothetical protein